MSVGLIAVLIRYGIPAAAYGIGRLHEFILNRKKGKVANAKTQNP